MGVAVITGASSGIGKELAREHAKRGGDVVLVARSKDRLRELAEELAAVHGVTAHVLDYDLSEAGAVAAVHKWVQKHALEVSVLINNAGFGGHGAFHERDWKDDQAMIRLNVEALTEMTRCFLPELVERGSGQVLNVGSTAGFLPGPLQAVYYATKAYVNSFSQAIAEELRGTGVTVTVLCPGPVATGFAEAADLEDLRVFKGAADPADVARYGYAAMERGRPVAVHGARYRMLLGTLGIMPRGVVVKASRKAMEK